MAGQLGAFTETLLNALPSVDTFFFLSGTLVAYLSFIQLEKKQFNIIMFYVHRYIRLGLELGRAGFRRLGLGSGQMLPARA